jgi:hypothetical protein
MSFRRTGAVGVFDMSEKPKDGPRSLCYWKSPVVSMLRSACIGG